MDTIFIYKTNGFYFGFVRNGFLFSAQGVYLGWIENNFVWDAAGKFRGAITDINGAKYIIVNRLMISPAPRTPKLPPNQEIPPNPQPNIIPITLSPELSDGFDGS
jgi:hypothetical protein